MLPETFRCFLVRKTGHGDIESGVERRPIRELPAGNVLLQVRYSSLNYKDAMAAVGHQGIVKNFPHVPGIDAAGTVLESSDPRFQPGSEVIATGHELGVERWGGWAEYIRIPGDWVLPLPQGLSLEEAMTLGTAGFTAAQCVWALLHHGLTPESGTVLVTGASGGVGSLSVSLLSQLGYRVVAMSGKPDRRGWLQQLGAAEVVGRDTLPDDERPLSSARFSAGIDTIGGRTLSSLVKSVSHRGCVACCGVAGGADLVLTVYPFILRGVTLAGIDSAWCPRDRRGEIWEKLASEWKPERLEMLRQIARLDDIPTRVEQILAGQIAGRVLVDPTPE